MHRRIVFIFSFFVGLTISSCTSNDVTNISENNGSESHNMGKNCMQCHTSGGNGSGIFKVAGTVYNETQTSTNPNGQVQLYTEADGAGQLIASIKVDSKGNFYTTNNISFTNGLYPVVISSSGNKKYMGEPAFKGECNSCHNVSTSKIYVN